MRMFISTFSGLTLITVMFMAGGAAMKPEQAASVVTLDPIGTAVHPVATPSLTLDVFTATGQPAPRAPIPQIADPGEGQALNQWFGCAPPREGSVCGALRETGIEALVPDEPASLEDWRPLVSVFFDPQDVDRAMAVIRCESGGDRWAKNPRSTASGLFQHLRSLWPPRAVAAGHEAADVFDPVANVAVAAWLVYEGGGWRHWNPSRACWR